MSGRKVVPLLYPATRWAAPLAGLAMATAGLLGPLAAGSVASAPVAAASVTALRTATFSWTTAAPPSSPPALAFAAAAYDPDTSPPTVVLFGGVTANGTVSGDTWTWNGSTWTDHPASAATNGPPPREQASMAFDEDLHQLILFGGSGTDGSYLDDTWAWNGASWYQLGTSAGAPPARQGASLAYEPGGGLLLYGGTGQAAGTGGGGAGGTGSTPASTPAGGASQNGATSGATPSGASVSGDNPSAAKGDGSAAGVRLAASVDAGSSVTLGDTWLWNGQSWTQVSVAGPPARTGASMAWDPAAAATVLFGGSSTVPFAGTSSGSLADTWLWNGRTWSSWSPPKTDTALPPARAMAPMVFVPTAAGTVLIGGSSGSGSLSDLWLWTATGWVHAAVSGFDPGRAGGAAVYDTAGGQVVVFGGTAGGGGYLADTGLVRYVPPPGHPTTPTTRPSSHPTSPPTTRASGHPTGSLPATTVPRHVTPTTTHHRSSGSTVAPTTTAGPPHPTLEASASNARRGTAVSLVGRGFAPGSVVTLSFHSVPVLIGQIRVGADGTFRTTVAVPTDAAPGEHHFVVTGDSRTGDSATLAAAVFVRLSSPSPVSSQAKLVMFGLALLIPLGAWGYLSAAGWWRSRSRARGAAGSSA